MINLKYSHLLILTLILFSCKGKSGKTKHLSSQHFSRETEMQLLVSGKIVYERYCVACHGADGEKRLNDAAELSSINKSRNKIKKKIRRGKRKMPAFEGILSEEEINAVAYYITNCL